MSLARQSAWAAAAAVALTGSRFALAAIIARRLVQARFGQFAYSQWLIDLTFLVCSLGATGVASRYVAEFRDRPAQLAALIGRWRTFAIALPIVAATGVLLAALASNLDVGPAAMTLLPFWAIANGIWAMQSAVLTGLQRFDLVFRANALAGAIMLIGAALLPRDGDNLALLFGLMTFASGAAASVGIAASSQLVSGKIEPLVGVKWRSIKQYAFNVWITGLLWSLVWSRGELPIVRGFLGDAGIAQYIAALSLFGGGVQGAMLAVSGVAPQLTMLLGTGRRAEAIATARSIMDVQIFVCAVATLIMICLGPELVLFAFGGPYQGASGPLAVLSLGILGLSVSSHNHLLQIESDARFSRNIMLVGLALLTATALILTRNFGLIGAAVARATTMLILAGVSLSTIIRRAGRSAITLRNLIAVTSIVSLTFGAVAVHLVEGILPRAIWLSAGILALAALLRDRHGRVLVTIVPRLLLTASH